MLSSLHLIANAKITNILIRLYFWITFVVLINVKVFIFNKLQI